MISDEKPLTAAQGAFGANFKNLAIINERPSWMSFGKYRQIRRDQNKLIKSVLR